MTPAFKHGSLAFAWLALALTTPRSTHAQPADPSRTGPAAAPPPAPAPPAATPPAATPPAATPPAATPPAATPPAGAPPAPPAPAPAPAAPAAPGPDAPAAAPAAPADPAAPPPGGDLPAEPERPPAEVSGLLEPRDPPAGPGRTAGRVALAPLRGAWWAIWAPVRGIAWAYDRFAVPSRVRQIFFSEDGRAGLFPVAAYKSGFGFGGGARLVLRDALGERSRLRFTATYGGEVLQAYTAKYRSGRLLGRRAELEVEAGYETFPRSRFFGIGNGDLVERDPMAPPLDPLRDDTAVDTRYYYDAVTAEAALSADPPGPARVRVYGGYRQRDFDRDSGDDDDVRAADVYDPARLVGFTQNLSTAHVELQLVVDTLRQPRFDVSRAAPSTGWYATARLGYAEGLGDDPSDYARWAIDVQRYLDLYASDRILVLRLAIEGVTGSLADVPFHDLPTIGGPVLLRGYPQDRFRDRHAGAASLEYQWGIDRNVTAFLFTDAGRVWRDRDDLDLGTDDLRVGFGGGLQIHSMRSFLARLVLASSVDGGVFFQLGFDPLAEKAGER